MVAFLQEEAQSENLPPTPAALRQAINRANYQALVWNLDTVPEPQLPSPETFGWKSQDEKWVPVTTSLPPAPEAIIQLVKCGCIKTRCSTNRCNCRKAELKCTNLCSCVWILMLTTKRRKRWSTKVVTVMRVIARLIAELHYAKYRSLCSIFSS